MSKNNPVIALAGNPNVGKTTLFNALTGSHQSVGNWPGVTVEHKQGYFLFKGKRYEVIDLPGIYSLAATSPDEQVARDYLLQKKPDLVINIVDASNLERNLYLTVQLMELGAPLLILLSMVDIAERNELRVEHEHLAEHLGVDVIPVSMAGRFDAHPLLYLLESRLDKSQTPATVRYDEVVEKSMAAIAAIVFDPARESGYPPAWDELPRHWLLLRLLERDPAFTGQLPPEGRQALEKVTLGVEKHRRQDVAAVLADDRYGFIRGLVKDVVKRKPHQPQTISDRIDRFALSGFWGGPIFLLVMFLVFMLSVRASAPLISLIDSGLNWLLVDQWGTLLRSLGLPKWFVFLFSDALGGGIATIGTFIPPIFFIFLSLSFLEDSGYMARAAFIADKFMRRVGLPGKAFIPLIVGFGCTVPAIMATRTLESKRDRVFASLLTPFMSCGAKLPVYTYLALIFFPRRAHLVVFGLYVFGIVMGLLFALALKKTLFKTQPGNFVMELPHYHLPTLNAMLMHTWHRLKDFILRAGKTILLVIVLVNILQVLQVPDPFHGGQSISILELAGRLLAPLLAPLGLGSSNWQASVALVSGLFAKEAIVGSLSGLYAGDAAIRAAFGGTASAIAYLIFILLYSPCAATLAILFREHGRRWMLLAFFYLTALAWIVATVAYQVLAFNPRSWLWLGISLLLGAALYLSMKFIGNKHAL